MRNQTCLGAFTNKVTSYLDEPIANLGYGRYDSFSKIKNETPIISHDRAPLDEICTIVEVAHGKITQYPGNFSEYERLKEAEKERCKKEYELIGEKKRPKRCMWKAEAC